MTPHDLVTLYHVKALEYLVSAAFLVLFVPFWRYVNGGVAATEPAVAGAPFADRVRGWLRIPERVLFHPGHAWARIEPDGLVTAGMSEFARRLVGPIDAVALPAVGAELRQGEPAWQIDADAERLPMLAPVSGTVVAVNTRAAGQPDALARDPYGEGWLVKIRPARLAGQLPHLKAGRAARRWLDEVCDELSTTLTPALGYVSQDGGELVDGLARAAAGDRWPVLARRLLLAEPTPADAYIDPVADATRRLQ